MRYLSRWPLLTRWGWEDKFSDILSRFISLKTSKRSSQEGVFSIDFNIWLESKKELMEQYVQHGECSVGNSKTKLIEYPTLFLISKHEFKKKWFKIFLRLFFFIRGMKTNDESQDIHGSDCNHVKIKYVFLISRFLFHFSQCVIKHSMLTFPLQVTSE